MTNSQPQTQRQSGRRRPTTDASAEALPARHHGDSSEHHAAERRLEILDVAAQLFAERGFRATSIRDIAERVGMLPGSLYYHIRSKEALFVEIHHKALDTAAERINAGVARHTTPWARLEAACAEMLETQLNPESLTLPIMNNLRSVPDEVTEALVLKRDEFEQIFRDLVNALPLPDEIDRNIYRILLLRLLNTADGWYREGRLSRPEIAAQIVAIFRHEAKA